MDVFLFNIDVSFILSILIFSRTYWWGKMFPPRVSMHFIKVKGKAHPRTGHEGPEGSKGIALLFLLPRH